MLATLLAAAAADPTSHSPTLPLNTAPGGLPTGKIRLKLDRELNSMLGMFTIHSRGWRGRVPRHAPLQRSR